VSVEDTDSRISRRVLFREVEMARPNKEHERELSIMETSDPAHVLARSYKSRTGSSEGTSAPD